MDSLKLKIGSAHQFSKRKLSLLGRLENLIKIFKSILGTGKERRWEQSER